jgi:hypothetical protein
MRFIADENVPIGVVEELIAPPTTLCRWQPSCPAFLIATYSDMRRRIPASS